jgi:hypothetical protein
VLDAEAESESESESDESELELAESTFPEDWLCALNKALRLSDEIWAVLNPETVDWAEDAAELSPAEKDPKKSVDCYDDPG